MTELKLKMRSDAATLKTLHELMERSGDVSFVDIYLALGGDPSRKDERDHRGRYYAQSWISGYIQKLNRHLEKHGLKIAPGRIKRTYCLTSIHS